MDYLLRYYSLYDFLLLRNEASRSSPCSIYSILYKAEQRLSSGYQENQFSLIQPWYIDVCD